MRLLTGGTTRAEVDARGGCWELEVLVDARDVSDWMSAGVDGEKILDNARSNNASGEF